MVMRRRMLWRLVTSSCLRSVLSGPCILYHIIQIIIVTSFLIHVIISGVVAVMHYTQHHHLAFDCLNELCARHHNQFNLQMLSLLDPILFPILPIPVVSVTSLVSAYLRSPFTSRCRRQSISSSTRRAILFSSWYTSGLMNQLLPKSMNTILFKVGL